ncbi:hypothetical protein IWQ62_000502 [Dispira parvispora]|uniref:CAP-Gly domain-containing protein n=1 Tax=Dispira parvispora TaxID=1520584 RepID=A0A9W8AUC0_9FUNG|nr:hypothetical protein IWQ62_000502 [Dispira parvispora]
MSVVTVWIQSPTTQSERRFDRGLTIDALKVKLEPITGIPADSQVLKLYQGEVFLVELQDASGQELGSYPVTDYCTIQVHSRDHTLPLNQYTDVSQVEKYEMSDVQYDSLRDSVRAFKKHQKIGRFNEDQQQKAIIADRRFEQEAKAIPVDARCQVVLCDDGLNKIGTVRYVGKLDDKRGYWVGIEYDEPLGKNDGSIDGHRYFTCRKNHGAFVRPNKVTVGDIAEEIDWDNLDEM